MRALLIIVVAALLAAAPAFASEERPTLRELEGEVMCPVCETTLDESRSPVADRMRAIIAARIAAGRTKSEIKDELVGEFGPGVLAAPPKRGFGLLAWLLPLGGSAVAACVVGLLAWRWSRRREDDTAEHEPVAADVPAEPLDDELAWRLDEELARFDA